MDETRNDGLHPRHPGLGKSAVIELESSSGEPEIGGFIVFLPSGATKSVHWRSAKPIQPTLDAAKDYCTTVVDSILRANKGNQGHPDIQRVNWTSMAAAIQRVIMDWNDKLQAAIRVKMTRDAIEGKVVNAGPGDRRIH